MCFDHCVNYVKFLFEGNYNFVNFIGTLQYKLFAFLSEEKESYLHEKKKQKTIKQTNKTITYISLIMLIYCINYVMYT